ncbi:Hypothetical protein CINCED_3A008950 [Cinara cedri]|uniref:Transmembrane protein 186 n=1 Tax=Cinara cedri TaxID=506608 RepID=A0A5E4N7T3_9HEMI|nr:Hypothetical protein CINCED_3A008950 [Cinara cedri]
MKKVDHHNTNSKDFIPIFKTPHMPIFIGSNKLKKYQTIGTFCLIPICFGLNMIDFLNFPEVICASLIGFGITAGLHLVTMFLSNNLVVYVYISPDEQKCRMSYVSYWGDRAELYCDIEDIEPIKYSKLDLLNNKIKVNGNKRIFKIIINNDSIILNSSKLRKVLGSDLV